MKAPLVLRRFLRLLALVDLFLLSLIVRAPATAGGSTFQDFDEPYRPQYHFSPPSAWMNNWNYAQNIPTSTWRGALTLPRELALKRTPQGIRLVQQPVAELRSLRGQHWKWENVAVAGKTDMLAEVTGETLEIIAEFDVSQSSDANRLGLRVRTGSGQYTTIGYASKQKKLFVDRARSGNGTFNPSFPGAHVASLEPIDGRIRLHVLVDRSSVEVLANDGLVSMTEQIFPDGASQGIELFADGGQAKLTSLDIYRLHAASATTPASTALDAGQPLPIALAVGLVVVLVMGAGAVYLIIRRPSRSPQGGNEPSSCLPHPTPRPTHFCLCQFRSILPWLPTPHATPSSTDPKFA